MPTRRGIAWVLAAIVWLSTTWGVPVADATQTDTGRVAVIGDSLTRGYGVRPEQSYAALLEARAAGRNVFPLAHDGATVRAWLTSYRVELAQLALWRPDTVLIALGGNDYYRSRSTADYSANLTELINVVRATTPGAQVLLWHYYQIGPAPVQHLCDVDQCSPAPRPPTWAQYGAAMHAVAVKMITGYIDNSGERPWIKEFPLPGEQPPVHLSWQGHRALAQSIHRQLPRRKSGGQIPRLR